MTDQKPDSEHGHQQNKQHDHKKYRRTSTFVLREFAPQLLQRTAANVSDVSGRTMLVPGDRFGGLSIDDCAEQNLSL